MEAEFPSVHPDDGAWVPEREPLVLGPRAVYSSIPPAQSGKATASLVLGIVGVPLACLLVPSLLAIVLGHMAKADIRSARRHGIGLAGELQATWGLILGYGVVGLAFGALAAWVLGQLVYSST